MQFQHLLAASRFLAPAQAFNRYQDEQAFRLEYRRGGFSMAVAVMLIGAIVSIGFIFLAEFSPVDDGNSASLQIMRAVIALSCSASLVTLLLRPEAAIQHHMLTVFAPCLIALTSLGCLMFFPMTELASNAAFSRSTLSVVLAVWFISAFCRLSLRQIMLLSVGVSIMNLAGLQSHQFEHLPFFALDLIVANLAAWMLTIQTEKRERKIWTLSKQSKKTLRSEESSARRVAALEQTQAKLTHIIGHDIRQPLSSSTFYLDDASKAANRSANQAMLQSINKVRTCLKSVEGTLERILEPNQRNNQSGLATERTNLGGVMADLDQIFSPQATRSGVGLYFRKSKSQALMARTNERVILEVLSNVVSNAIKYTAISSQVKPSVTISAIADDDAIRVEITDNGIGIPDDLHAKIFDEHYRAPASIEQVDGSGLGLAVVESSLQRLPDHSLRLQSTVGEGTRVQIYLPCA